MNNKKAIVCEICGRTAEVDLKRKLNYCDNKSCEQELKKRRRKEVLEKYLENKESRTKRRMSKYRHAILKAMLDNITIKNPNKFVVTAINGGKDTRDFEEYVEELKKDDTLFKAQ